MLQNFHRNMKRKEAFEKQGFSIAQTLGTGGKVSKNDWPGNYLAVQWVGLHPFTAEGLGSILQAVWRSQNSFLIKQKER